MSCPFFLNVAGGAQNQQKQTPRRVFKSGSAASDPCYTLFELISNMSAPTTGKGWSGRKVVVLQRRLKEPEDQPEQLRQGSDDLDLEPQNLELGSPAAQARQTSEQAKLQAAPQAPW